MKKYFAVLLLLLLAVLAHGCTIAPATPTTTENFKEQGFISESIVYYRDLDTLNSVLEKIEVPEGFVRYEQIEKYGSFRSMAFTSDEPDRTNKYAYYLAESNLYLFGLEFNHGKQTKTEPLLENPEFVSGMKYLKSISSGWVFRCGAYYYYDAGVLKQVLWRSDGIECTLFVHDRMEYPKSWWRSSFVQTMLYGSDRQIERALEDFTKQLQSSGNEADTLTIILCSAAVVVAALAVFLILRARRAKRKAPTPACAVPEGPEAPTTPNYLDEPDFPDDPESPEGPDTP